MGNATASNTAFNCLPLKVESSLQFSCSKSSRSELMDRESSDMKESSGTSQSQKPGPLDSEASSNNESSERKHEHIPNNALVDGSRWQSNVGRGSLQIMRRAFIAAIERVEPILGAQHRSVKSGLDTGRDGLVICCHSETHNSRANATCVLHIVGHNSIKNNGNNSNILLDTTVTYTRLLTFPESLLLYCIY
jgi:hypothetical protein